MGLAWGGFRNGNIPTSSLHEVPNFSALGIGFSASKSGSNLMKTEAAVQLSGLMRAFYDYFGVALLLSEGYRPVSVQNQYWDRYIHRKPHWTIAAIPGTSIHGWGLSADLNVNGGNPAGEHLAWLRANAGKYGFVNDVSSEPWHWSYRSDLIRKTVTVNPYISNPNISATQTEQPVALVNKEQKRVVTFIKDARSDAIWLVSLITGQRVQIANPSDLRLLKRIVNNDGSDRMLAVELDQMRAKYFSKIK